MSRPSSRTSSQRSSAWRSRAWVTGAPSCQNVPARSRRRPIARIFSISSGVSSMRRTLTSRSDARRAIRSLVRSFCFLSRAISSLFGRRQRAAASRAVAPARRGGGVRRSARRGSSCFGLECSRRLRILASSDRCRTDTGVQRLRSAPGTPSGYLISASDGRMYVGAPPTRTSTRAPASASSATALPHGVTGSTTSWRFATPRRSRRRVRDAERRRRAPRARPRARCRAALVVAIAVAAIRAGVDLAACRASSTATTSASSRRRALARAPRARAPRATTPPTAGASRRTRCPSRSPCRCAGR